MPSFLLQPLIENAVEHGLAGQSRAGRITLRARRDNGTLELSVADDGAGLPETGKALEHGVGLNNTAERLKQLYGERSHLTIQNAAAGGVEVTVTLPFRNDG